MLRSARRQIAEVTETIKVPSEVLISAGTVTSFFWLLLQNKIHPIVVYLLQVYLTF